MKKIVDHQFIKFILVGLLNTVFGYSVFSLLIFLKLHYALAILLATVVGVIFNFKTMGKLVFKNNKNHLFFKFIVVYTVTYFLNVFLVKMMVSSINIYIAGAIAMLVAAILSYSLNRNWVFKEFPHALN